MLPMTQAQILSEHLVQDDLTDPSLCTDPLPTILTALPSLSIATRQQPQVPFTPSDPVLDR